MKNYVCAISLLISGLAYFATQVATQDIELPPGMWSSRRGCEWQGSYINEGTYKIEECSQLTCDSSGKATMQICPVADCPDGHYLHSYSWPVYEKPFPDCCPKFVCRKKPPGLVGK
ncbi:uncharacterized protein LOC118647797 [Monomorium pharaonis]|uniref:uncharacterized protein LOC118647797 n=1 Tax=Monomorium pharaonis TaxID=307658 RepID=UPI001745C5AC|nr:uncharacterized protein LOC118647797 [Monomorium pharaonis]